MKKPLRLMSVFRCVMLAAAALAVYLPAKNLPKQAVAGAQVKQSQSITVASAQASWQAVFAAGY